MHPTRGASQDLASGHSRRRAEGKRVGNGAASSPADCLGASCCLDPSSPLYVAGAGSAFGAGAAVGKGLGAAERR